MTPDKGNCEGTEVCQLYVRHIKGKSRTEQELKGFARVELAPGKSCIVTIDVPIELFGHFSADGILTIMPGQIELLIGASASDIRLRANVNVIGESVTQTGRKHFFSTIKLR